MDTHTKPPPPYDGPHDPRIITSPPMTVLQPVIMVDPRVPMGTHPQSIECRNCNHPINTELRYRSSTKTHLFALLFCLTGLWPCVCIPYCMNTCKNVDHYCPYCEHYIGSHYA